MIKISQMILLILNIANSKLIILHLLYNLYQNENKDYKKLINNNKSKEYQFVYKVCNYIFCKGYPSSNNIMLF